MIKLLADLCSSTGDKQMQFGVLRNFSTQCLFQDPDCPDLTKDVGNPVAYPSFIWSLINNIAQTGELEKCSHKNQWPLSYPELIRGCSLSLPAPFLLLFIIHTPPQLPPEHLKDTMSFPNNSFGSFRESFFKELKQIPQQIPPSVLILVPGSHSSRNNLRSLRPGQAELRAIYHRGRGFTLRSVREEFCLWQDVVILQLNFNIVCQKCAVLPTLAGNQSTITT